MKQLFTLAVTLLIAIATIGQNNLFSNISTTDQYDEYWSIQDPDGDGNYLIKKNDL